jgi:hypothetical protein
MPFSVRDIQSTPNPNALKFVLDRIISREPASFFNAEAAAGHPIAIRMFAIPGVASVLLLGDFVTVNKTPAARWKPIRERVRRVLTEA